MASDRRWTGGTANRDWCAGVAVVPETGPERLAEGVAAYVADCRRHRAFLSPAYHPTGDGACKAVFHRGPGEAAFIRARLRELTAPATGDAS